MSKIQLKAHGAWLGGGTGAGVASLIVGLLQQHVTHHPLAQVDVQAVYSIVAVAGAFLGSYVLPTLQRDVPGLVTQESLSNAETVAAALRDEVAELRAAKTDVPNVQVHVNHDTSRASSGAIADAINAAVRANARASAPTFAPGQYAVRTDLPPSKPPAPPPPAPVTTPAADVPAQTPATP